MTKAEWQKECRRLDDELCRGCGKPADEVHHIIHGWRKKIHELWNGICLCRACHIGVHQGIKYAGKRMTGKEWMMKILLLQMNTDEDRWAETRFELNKKLPREE